MTNNYVAVHWPSDGEEETEHFKVPEVAVTIAENTEQAKANIEAHLATYGIVWESYDLTVILGGTGSVLIDPPEEDEEDF